MQKITNIIYSESVAVFFHYYYFYLKYSIIAQWKEKLYHNYEIFFKFIFPVLKRMDEKAD